MLLRNLESYENTQQAILFVLASLAEMLREKKYWEVNRAIKFIDVESTDLRILTSFLLATVRIDKEHLPDRVEFFKRVEKKWKKEHPSGDVCEMGQNGKPYLDWKATADWIERLK